jgi:DNA-binding NarL/FixJ family response regulator
VIRVWIETSSPVARAGLVALLEHAPAIELVSDADEAGVVLRDESAASHAAPDDVPVVLLTSEPLTARAFRLGVRAVLPSYAGPAQIVAAIHAVAAGLVALPAEAAPLLTSADVASIEAEALTAREMDVLEMLAEGLSNKQIAARLGISEHTAKFHVNSIFGKLEAGTRTEAVTRGIRLGILKI